MSGDGLTVEDIFPYLLQRGLVSSADLLASEWTAGQYDSTRPVLIAKRSATDGFVIKFAPEGRRRSRELLGKEAALLQLFATPSWTDAQAFAPRLRYHDRLQHVLVMDFVPRPTALQYLQRSGFDAYAMGNAIGDTLARAHGHDLGVAETTHLFPVDLPWVLVFEPLAHDAPSSENVRKLIALIQDEKRVVARIAALREGWRPTRFIHGDPKLDNVLISEALEVSLVDWGHAGRGDPAWDVGMVWHSLLLFWLQHLGLSAKTMSDGDGEEQGELEAMRSATAGLFEGYCRRADLDSASEEFMLVALGYAGAAIVQTVVASAHLVEHLSLRQARTAQVGLNLMVDPAAYLQFLVAPSASASK